MRKQGKPAAARRDLSWWVGKSRKALDKGAKRLAAREKVNPSRNVRPKSRAAVKAARQAVVSTAATRKSAGVGKKGKSGDKQTRDRDRIAQELQDKLQPLAGAFTEIPMAEVEP